MEFTMLGAVGSIVFSGVGYMAVAAGGAYLGKYKISLNPLAVEQVLNGTRFAGNVFLKTHGVVIGQAFLGAFAGVAILGALH